MYSTAQKSIDLQLCRSISFLISCSLSLSLSLCVSFVQFYTFQLHCAYFLIFHAFFFWLASSSFSKPIYFPSSVSSYLVIMPLFLNSCHYYFMPNQLTNPYRYISCTVLSLSFYICIQSNPSIFITILFSAPAYLAHIICTHLWRV